MLSKQTKVVLRMLFTIHCMPHIFMHKGQFSREIQYVLYNVCGALF